MPKLGGDATQGSSSDSSGCGRLMLAGVKVAAGLCSGMSELPAALAGAIVGGLIAFASAWGLRAIENTTEAAALREQVTSLMQMLEGRMIGMSNHDQWFRGFGWGVADLLVDRMFSKEGTIAFAGCKVNGESIFSVSTEIQRTVVNSQQVIEKLDALRTAAKGGDFYQSGPSKCDALFRELHSYAGHARQLLKDSRSALGDLAVVGDPIPDEPPTRFGEVPTESRALGRDIK
ncbi:MAG: hypothetical protein ACYCUI_11710 [Vulcanimicrobiaceae bacterium]